MIIWRGNEDSGHVEKIISSSSDLGVVELKEIEGQLKTLKEKVSGPLKHPTLSNFDFSIINTAIDQINVDIQHFKDEVTRFQEIINVKIEEKINEIKGIPDKIHPAIQENFRIGPEYTSNDLMKIIKEGEFRYGQHMPPGYMDSKNKQGIGKYGDLIVWKQILDIAKMHNNSVIFVINDVKEDWWDKDKKAPRFELLFEFSSHVKKSFWSCRFSEFLHLIKLIYFVDNNDAAEAIKEMQKYEVDIRIKDEQTEKDRLYQEIVDKWLCENTDLKILNELEYNSEWRVFGNSHFYATKNNLNYNYLIALNYLDSVSYAKALHAFSNLPNIIKYYEKFGYEYKGCQIILVSSRDKWEELKKTMETHTKLNKAFNDKRVTNIVFFIERGKLIPLFSKINGDFLALSPHGFPNYDYKNNVQSS